MGSTHSLTCTLFLSLTRKNTRKVRTFSINQSAILLGAA